MTDGEPPLRRVIAGWAASVATLLVTVGLLARYLHRPGARSVLGLYPRAFDGSSVMASGAVSLATLALAVGVGFVGVKQSPRSWSLVGASAALLLTALAMVTVTLGAGESAPPDGALLLPYLLPAALTLLGAGLASRGAWLAAGETFARRLGVIPIGVVAGALVFLAYETSKLPWPSMLTR